MRIEIAVTEHGRGDRPGEGQESDGGVTVTARLDPQALGRFEQLRPDLIMRLAISSWSSTCQPK